MLPKWEDLPNGHEQAHGEERSHIGLARRCDAAVFEQRVNQAKA